MYERVKAIQLARYPYEKDGVDGGVRCAARAVPRLTTINGRVADRQPRHLAVP